MTGAGPVSPGDGASRPADPAGTAPVTVPRPARWLPAVLALAVVAADQATKLWALSRLAGHAPIELAGNWVALRLVSNPGAAFSVGTGATWVFTVCAAAAVVIVPWFAARARSRSQAIALGLLAGGAAGNLLDRLLRAPGPGVGRVVDFIDYHGWFIGNVADIAIVASAALLILGAVTASGHRHRAQHPSA